MNSFRLSIITQVVVETRAARAVLIRNDLMSRSGFGGPVESTGLRKPELKPRPTKLSSCNTVTPAVRIEPINPSAQPGVAVPLRIEDAGPRAGATQTKLRFSHTGLISRNIELLHTPVFRSRPQAFHSFSGSIFRFVLLSRTGAPIICLPRSEAEE